MDKTTLKNWIDNSFDYRTAVSMFEKYGKNKNLSKFFNTGNENAHKTGKLKYELMKVAQYIPEIPDDNTILFRNGTGFKLSKTGASRGSIMPDKGVYDLPKTDWPDEILLKIKEKGDLSSQKDKLHRQKSGISDSNTPENIKKRKELSDQILILTDHIETCRAIINKFQKDGVIDLTIQVKKQPVESKKPAIDIKSMTDIERMKKINSLNPVISKANKKLKDMPDGPKKQKLIKKNEADCKLLQELKNMVK